MNVPTEQTKAQDAQQASQSDVLRLPGLRRPIDVSHAIILGAVIVVLGTFAVNNLHDLKERRDRAAIAARALTCRHWDEAARLAAFDQAQEFIRRPHAPGDVRANAEYWLAKSKVQGWYADESAAHAPGEPVARPSHC